MKRGGTKKQKKNERFVLLSCLFNLLEEHVEGAGLLAEVADGNARALEVLLDGAGAVALDEAGPLGELGALGDTHEVDVVLGAERGDELLVAGFLAVVGEDAEVGGARVEGASDLGDAADEAVDLDRLLDDDAERGFDVFGFDVGFVGDNDGCGDDGFSGLFGGH